MLTGACRSVVTGGTTFLGEMAGAVVGGWLGGTVGAVVEDVWCRVGESDASASEMGTLDEGERSAAGAAAAAFPKGRSLLGLLAAASALRSVQSLNSTNVPTSTAKGTCRE